MVKNTVAIAKHNELKEGWDRMHGVVETVLKLAKKKGADAAAAGAMLNSGFSTTVRCGEIDTVEFNRDKAVGITVYCGKRKGNVSTTDIDDKSLEKAVNAALRIAKLTEEDEFNGLADANLMAKNMQDLKLFYPTAVTADAAEKLALECEKFALDYDKEISNSEGASFGEYLKYGVYGNSHGFMGAQPSSNYSLSCSIIGNRDGHMQTDYDYSVAREFKELKSAKEVGEHAANKVISHLGARKIKTRTAPVLFTPLRAKSLVSSLIAAISGGSLYRKASFLLDKLNTKIFPDFITIKEEPFLLKGWGSRCFDNEGVATREHDIVTNGMLKSYVLNSYAARKLGMKTTGNAGGTHNLRLMPGRETYDDLVRNMGTGMIVTSILGHGPNIITGDYSQGARGYWVENGEIQYPVEEVTIASNLKDMFSSIEAVANDVDHRSSILTGSILVGEMTIAGK